MPANPFAPATTHVSSIAGGESATSEHDRALAAVLSWHRSRNQKQVFRLFGPAGSGKTSLARKIADNIRGNVLFAAYSGKAASVLRKKGNSTASTIHKLIYIPTDVDRKGAVTSIINEASPLKSASLLIIDECSMVDRKVGRDLESFGTPILVLGDKAQLPPIEGAGYFSGAAADFELTQIHRQSAENPIIDLATRARSQQKLQVGDYGQSKVLSALNLPFSDVTGADQVLAGTWTRLIYINTRIREILGHPLGTPVPGDKLVCRKNNARTHLFNGEIWFVHNVTETKNGVVHMIVQSEIDDRQVAVQVDLRFFTIKTKDEFDQLNVANKGKHHFTFGYALTVHQAQGSEWDRVVLFDDSASFPAYQFKWLYTGITRAARSIMVVQP